MITVSTTTMKPILTLLTALLLAPLAAQPAEPMPADWMPGVEDRTGLWWVHGAPKAFQSDARSTEETLCFQCGNEKLLFDTRRVRPVEGEWECVVIAEGRRFACSGHMQTEDEWHQPVRFVESGRLFQRVAIEALTFADADGEAFGGTARLEISVWPDRLAFRLECAGDVVMELRHNAMKVTGGKSIVLEVHSGEARAEVESELPVTRDETLGCHRLALPEEPWSNAGGTYYPEEHLDRIDRWRVTLRNDADTPTVARLMFTQQHHLPITGFTPMLCEPDGTPTGIPVQLSKNWHLRPDKGHLPHEGPWFHGFAWVRVPPKSRRELVFQMVYARYGGVCAATHAQLSLIGWGHNQFWDQAAVGSFGESICFEPGRVQRRCFITDMRPLMTLPREPGAKRWGWAENCGGGDFVLWTNEQGRYQTMKTTRTDYRSHGPCLTDVRYSEETSGGEIAACMDVSVPAANDYLRTFMRLRYDVRQPVRWQRLAFFQLGADYYNATPARRVAVGDANGLREEWEPRRAKDEYDRIAMPLAGDAAWVSVHGLEDAALTQGNAAASRGLIVRSWRAVLGGKPASPHLSTFCTEWGQNNHRTSVELAPPPDVTELMPGDFVEAELELVVFPADAAAYYGPDAALRELLARYPDTWRPVHRETVGNAMKPTAQRGTIVKTYPLVIAVDEQQNAHVKLTGGLGHIPVTFTGLTDPRGHCLLANGKPLEHWQTDWNPATQRWQIVCNAASTEAAGLALELKSLK
ncbi:MAG: hypothetical protein FJ276_05825 [Planctomycetes bacterium]|nr:hypothetical protein [Planctomycetota bacterium]